MKDHRKTKAQLIEELEGLRVRLSRLESAESERSWAGEALASSEEDLRTIVDHINDGVYLVDDRGFFTFVNRVIEERSGIPLEEFKKLHFLDVVRPEDHEFVRGNFERVISGENVPPYELRYKTSRGEVLTVEVNTTPIYEGDRVAGVLGTSRDLSERKRAEKKLRAEHSFRRAIIERAGDGICVCHEVPDYPYIRFTVWNHRMIEITGYTVKEINELGWYQSVYPDEELQKRAIERMDRMRRGEDLVAEDWEITRKDGEKRFVSISTSILEGDRDSVHVLALMQDVTDRKRAEDRLARSEKKYRDLYEGLREGVAAVDMEGRIVEFNRVFRDMLGYEEGEVHRLTYRDITPEKWHPMEERIIKEQVLTRGYSDIYQKEYIRKDGATFPVELRTYLIRDEEERPTGMWATIRDITQIKRAEEALRESEERYRSLFKNNHSVMLLIDPDTAKIVDANPAACSFYGWDLHELTGKKITEINNLTEGEVFEEIERAKSGGRNHFFFRHRLKSGEIRDVEVYSGPIRLHGKKLLYSIIHDITERKRVEGALRESEEKYRAFFKTTRDIAFITSKDGRWVDMSDSAPEFFGYEKREELQGVRIPDLYDNPEERLSHIGKIERDGYTREYPVNLKKRDGSVINTLITSVSIRDEHGEVIGFQGTIRDVTAQKRAEEALRESEKRLARINETFLGFGTDHLENISSLTALAGELLGGDCALYNRLDGGMLVSLGQWQIPEDYNPVDRPEGHICYDVIKSSGEDVFIVRDLLNTHYAKTDPNVELYKLKTYIGKAVKSGGVAVGSLCVVFQTDYEPTDEDKKVLEIIASAIGVEEERKHAEKKLKESETNYKMLVKSLPAVVFKGYPDFSVDFFDEKVLELTGYPKEEFDSRRLRWSDIVVEEDLDEMKGVVTAAHRGTGSYVREYRIRDGDGNIRWVQGRGQIVRDNDGRIAYVSGVLFDITERKIAEEALRREKEKFQVMVEEAPLGISIIGRDGTYEYANSKFMEMFGYTLEEVPSGRAWFEKAYPVSDYRDEVISTWISDLKESREGESRPRIFTVRCKDGTDKIIHFRPVTMTGGQQLVIYEDITEHQKAQEALKESEEKFRELAELLPETIFEMDLQGVLTYANRNAFEHFKYTQEDFDSGLNCFEMIAPEDRDRARENVSNILKGEAIGVTEYRALRKDGTTFPALLRSSPIVRGGKPIGLRGFIIDITETKRLESQLLSAQKMEALGTLAGGIAHDFNNILGAIIGNTEIALLDLDKKAQLKESLDQVLRASRRASELVGQILAISRKTEHEKRPAKLKLILMEAIRMLRATLPSVIEIREDFTAHEDHILADHTQMHQVLMNLCTNAAHAMRDGGGVLHLGLSNVEVGSGPEATLLGLPPGDYVKLTVKDTGHGMEESVLERIFDPYFTTKEKGEGTGLGLAVVESIVTGHNGTITVASKPGMGTEFTVYLPVTPEDATGEEVLAESIPGGNERILFVDDERALVKMAQKMLTRLGYEVTAFTSSLEALEAFRENPGGFDLVITDMTMPHMTGAELARELLKLRPDVPLILCTGFSEAISSEKAKELGIREYVMKPIYTREMAVTVRRVIEGAKKP